MRLARIRSHPVGMPVWAVWAGRHVLPIARPFHPGVDRFAGNLSLECTGRSEGHIDRRRTGPDHLLRSSISRASRSRGIDPPQKATVARGGRIGYVFSADRTGPTSIVFRLQTQQPGLQAYAVGIGDDVSERSTFIFP